MFLEAVRDMREWDCIYPSQAGYNVGEGNPMFPAVLCPSFLTLCWKNNHFRVRLQWKLQTYQKLGPLHWCRLLIIKNSVSFENVHLCTRGETVNPGLITGAVIANSRIRPQTLDLLSEGTMVLFWARRVMGQTNSS